MKHIYSQKAQKHKSSKAHMYLSTFNLKTPPADLAWKSLGPGGKSKKPAAVRAFGQSLDFGFLPQATVFILALNSVTHVCFKDVIGPLGYTQWLTRLKYNNIVFSKKFYTLPITIAFV
ncbi:hypothetical protein [Paenibacillus sp. UMB7766-LJ446]|uniref:hypothetical protein n=1 Tax=Paenibacillus sp. UMB7766-LJ446 TaxID=3046313 RepID=UPI002549CE14|nr:hypothetical protein [Paenibacillus sp. UMB7766-LJ446]